MDVIRTDRSVKGILSYIVLTSIYLTGQYIETGIGFTIYWFYFPYAFLIFLGIVKDSKFDLRILLFLVALVIFSLATFQYGFPLVIKQLFNISFSLFAFYYLIKFEQFNFPAILSKYIQISKVVLVLGYVQVFLFAIGGDQYFGFVFPFVRETNISIRMQSIATEPSFLTLGLTPVVFLSLYNLFYRRTFYLNWKWCLLFVGGYLLTLASTAYLGLLLMLAILYFKNFSVRKFLWSIGALTGIFLFVILAYSFIPLIKERVDDTVMGLRGNFVQNGKYREYNLSTYILLSNFHVVKQSLKDRPLTGYGLGTHELTYDHYLPAEMRAYSSLNRNDAGSMAFRLITETGILGLFVFCFFTLRYRIRSRAWFSDEEEILWIINASAFVLIFLYLLRNGNYTFNGKMLFMLLYFYSYKAIVMTKKIER